MIPVLMSVAITLVFFSYMFTHAYEQVKPFFWLAIISISRVSVRSFLIAKNKKWMNILACNLPMIFFIFVFLPPENLNKEFMVNNALPYVFMIIVQIVSCKILQKKNSIV